jgi:hypothetical protein
MRRRCRGGVVEVCKWCNAHVYYQCVILQLLTTLTRVLVCVFLSA